MFDSATKGTGWSITKIIIAIIAIVIGISQLIFASQMVLFDNDNVGTELTSSNFENVKDGELVWGKIDSIIDVTNIADSSGNQLKYFIVKSDSGKLMLFRTPVNSKCDYALQKVLLRESKEVYFKGKVKLMTKALSDSISMSLLMNNTLINNGIHEKFSDISINYIVDTSLYDTYVDKNKTIIASTVGAIIMFLIALLCIRKFVFDLIYSIRVAKGNIEPYVPEVDLTPKDKNILTTRSKRGEIAYEPVLKEDEMIEYYSGYENDAIDFSQNEKRVTIYGEEYEKPILEKDIEMYSGYEYDSLDFVQKPVEKKDISDF